MSLTFEHLDLRKDAWLKGRRPNFGHLFDVSRSGFSFEWKQAFSLPCSSRRLLCVLMFAVGSCFVPVFPVPVPIY